MKRLQKILVLFLIGSLLIGCKSFMLIEKVTVPNDTDLTKKENLNRQLREVEYDEKIQVYLSDGKSYSLRYVSHTEDTLNTKPLEKNISASKDPDLKGIALADIERINVWRNDKVMTIVVPASIVVLTILFLINWANTWTLG